MPWKQSLVVCVIGLISCAADAQQETPSVGCDRYAASDYLQGGSGIAFEKIDPTVAIPACEEALRQDPNSARLAFELGRSKLKADDYDSALRLFHQAADRGFAPAFGSIGSMYLEGKGVAKDEHVAFDWLMKAAVRGFAGSQMSLGYVFENGLGVSQDYAAAFKWYHLAAVQGFPSAQDSVGYFYAKGLGVHQDDREAALWIAKAARQGMAGAQYNLGTMYESGQGVQTSRSVAMTWYKKAADQGNAAAKKKLTGLGASETSIGSALPPMTELKKKAAASCWSQNEIQINSCYNEALKGYRGHPNDLLSLDARDAVTYCGGAAESNDSQFCSDLRNRYAALFTEE